MHRAFVVFSRETSLRVEQRGARLWVSVQVESIRSSPPRRPRKDGLTHPAATPRSNLAAASVGFRGGGFSNPKSRVKETHHGDGAFVGEVGQHMGHGPCTHSEGRVFKHTHGPIPHHGAMPTECRTKRRHRAVADVHACASRMPRLG
jgi:hypothetical protein